MNTNRQRSGNDYLINLKAEIEIRNLHQKVNLLIEEQIKVLIDIQEVKLRCYSIWKTDWINI
jgi:uncharacterized membrane protein